MLLGTVAAAVMLPQFAFFVPVVFGAWLLARFGFAPRFLRPRHPAVRLVPGPDAALTCVSFTVEAEREHGEVLETLRRAASASRTIAASSEVTTPRFTASSSDAPRSSAPRLTAWRTRS